MKTVSLSTGEWLLVEVPEDSLTVDWNITGKWIYLSPLSFRIEIPPGQYSIVGIAKDLTEEQWKGIVEQYGDGYEHYMSDDQYEKSDRIDLLATATLSGLSLLSSNGFEKDTCLILRKEK